MAKGVKCEKKNLTLYYTFYHLEMFVYFGVCNYSNENLENAARFGRRNQGRSCIQKFRNRGRDNQREEMCLGPWRGLCE